MALEYFTHAELNALPNMGEDRYSEVRKEAAAAYVVAIIEREVGVSFIPRTVTVTRDGGGSAIVLDPFARSLSSVSVGGVSLSVGSLLLRSGVISQADQTPFASGWQNVSVTYVTGYSETPPADIKEAALKATRWHLIATNSNSDMNARQTSMTNDIGTIQYAVAGPDRPTGYPDVDAVIIGWRDKLRVYGFA